MTIKERAVEGISKVKTYWTTPMAGRYMSFREIAAYSGGGIGAYMIITLGTACLLAMQNTLLSSVLGIDPTDMYVMYVIAVLANIPLTGIRANIIDNTRNKKGKYRPYILTMAIPTAIICVTMVWFPYSSLEKIVGNDILFQDVTADYFAKCAVIMILNLLLHFFYYFFYDAYENLIHVLSPNSQERADVASIKSVVYSLAPTLVNLFTPIIADNIFHTNMTDIRVFRLLYPILAVFGILLCIIVYKFTEEKIVQARTHVVQIKFLDALKAVAKNKYFWIISLAGWIGFLENSYANVLNWLYNYGGACNGATFALIQTVYGNASLWGMLAAPFCIRKWGKKSVLIITNVFNIIFILAMLLFTDEITYNVTILLVMSCLWFNALMGSFAHILNPAIQADIRDYQQYKTGERIDGMFSAVATIGTVITLLLSSIVSFIYEQKGITKAKAFEVMHNKEILARELNGGDTTVGQVIKDQLAAGQDPYDNAYNALYDPNILIDLIQVIIIIAAIGAFLNVIPYIWYDFNEKKQKSIVRVLKIRAMFEDYGNGINNDANLVEAVEIIRDAKELEGKEHVDASKKSYKAIKDKAERKAAKKQYKEALKLNEEIDISVFVCDELNKFDTPEFEYRVEKSKELVEAGLDGLYNLDVEAVKAELAAAKSMPKDSAENKALRSAAIEIAKQKLSAYKSIQKHYVKTNISFCELKYAELEKCFNKEDMLEAKLKALNFELKDAKKAFSKHSNKKNAEAVDELIAKIKSYDEKLKEARKQTKAENDRQGNFARCAKPYLDAQKLLIQQENYQHFEEISSTYESAKARHERALAKKQADAEKKKREEAAINAKIKADRLAKKAAKKAAKKNK